MGGRVAADLEAGVAQPAQLAGVHDPRPGRRRVRIAEPAGDDEHRRGRVELGEQGRERLQVVDEPVVESERSEPGAVGFRCEVAERDEPITPLTELRHLPPKILRAHEETIRVAAERDVRDPVVSEGKRRQVPGHTEIVRPRSGADLLEMDRPVISDGCRASPASWGRRRKLRLSL